MARLSHIAIPETKAISSTKTALTGAAQAVMRTTVKYARSLFSLIYSKLSTLIMTVDINCNDAPPRSLQRWNRMLDLKKSRDVFLGLTPGGDVVIG